jgi:hypothetical protein
MWQYSTEQINAIGVGVSGGQMESCREIDVETDAGGRIISGAIDVGRAGIMAK